MSIESVFIEMTVFVAQVETVNIMLMFVHGTFVLLQNELNPLFSTEFVPLYRL